LEDAPTDSGYEVLKPQNGTEALKEIDTDAASFRAIVTDIRLGGK
jgi:hypothetical protein